MPFAWPDYSGQITMIYGSDDKNPFVNIIDYKLDGPYVGDPWDAPNSILSSIDAVYTPAMVACMTTECYLFGYTCTYHASGNVYTGSIVSSTHAGTVSGDTLPDYAAVVIQKHTPIPGKTGRGRWFIGCVPESFTNTSRLEPAAIAVYEALGAALGASPMVTGVHLIPQVLSRKDADLYYIEHTHVDINLATQRRRRVRRLV